VVEGVTPEPPAPATARGDGSQKMGGKAPRRPFSGVSLSGGLGGVVEPLGPGVCVSPVPPGLRCPPPGLIVHMELNLIN